MIVSATGVWSYGKCGWGMTMLNKPLKVNTKHLPVKIGDTPIGLSSWYKNPPSEKIHTLNDDDMGSDYLCPMKGSKRAIASEYGIQVYAYEYAIARMMGYKFGRMFKNKGIRMVVLSGEPCFFDTPAQCLSKVRNEFALGALDAMGEDAFYARYENDFLFFLVSDKTVFINLYGLKDEERQSIFNLRYQLIGIKND